MNTTRQNPRRLIKSSEEFVRGFRPAGYEASDSAKDNETEPKNDGDLHAWH
jgi:hypothetical protein